MVVPRNSIDSKLVEFGTQHILMRKCCPVLFVWYSIPRNRKRQTAGENGQEVGHAGKVTAKGRGGPYVAEEGCYYRKRNRQEVLPGENKGSRGKSRGLFGNHCF